MTEDIRSSPSVSSSRRKYVKNKVSNIKSKISAPSLSLFNENLSLTENISSAKESLSLSLPLPGPDRIKEKVRGFTDMKLLRSKSCERVLQRCRKGFERVTKLKKESQPEDHFYHTATLRQSRRSRTKKAKPSVTTYSQYARAVCDVTPSPYDTEALHLHVGDLIGIISKHPSGQWTGECEGKVGRFKFINVEIVEGESVTVNSLQGSTVDNISDLLTKLNLSDLTSKLELNGFDKLECLETISRADLTYLGVASTTEQDKIIQAGALLRSGSLKVATPAEEGENQPDSGYFDGEREGEGEAAGRQRSTPRSSLYSLSEVEEADFQCNYRPESMRRTSQLSTFSQNSSALSCSHLSQLKF